jgi:hypothetical protein
VLGAKGIGKSVVLGAITIATMAADHYGWPTVHVEVGTEAPSPTRSSTASPPPKAVLEEPVPGSPAELQTLAARLGALNEARRMSAVALPGPSPPRWPSNGR